MMPVHRLGHMRDEARALARDVPAYRQVLTRQPEDLLSELDDFIVQVVHEGELRGGAEAIASERDAHITLAIRSLIDHWPNLAPAHPDAETFSSREGTGS